MHPCSAVPGACDKQRAQVRMVSLACTADCKRLQGPRCWHTSAFGAEPARVMMPECVMMMPQVLHSCCGPAGRQGSSWRLHTLPQWIHPRAAYGFRWTVHWRELLVGACKRRGCMHAGYVGVVCKTILLMFACASATIATRQHSYSRSRPFGLVSSSVYSQHTSSVK